MTSEALYHLLGGKSHGWSVWRVKVGKEWHWFLRDINDLILDATVMQFKTPPDYRKAVCTAFLTKFPSARARALMVRLVWQS